MQTLTGMFHLQQSYLGLTSLLLGPIWRTRNLKNSYFTRPAQPFANTAAFYSLLRVCGRFVLPLKAIESG